jgi:hypothetical protein
MMARLAGADARGRRLERRDAGAFLAHEGARRAGHLVDDGDIAGQQVGKLRQKQRRAQIGGQRSFSSTSGRGAGLAPAMIVRRLQSSRSPPPAATIMSIDAHSASSVFMPASSSARPARIDAQPLPGFHLALVAALGNLQVPVDLRQPDGPDRAGSAPVDDRRWQIRGGKACQCVSTPSPRHETSPMPVMTTSWRSCCVPIAGRQASGRRLLGRHQCVDLGAQVLHDEIFVRRNLAVIDFLRPLLERHLDAEFLVDGEDDVEEIQAVDAQIVNSVAFGRDLVDVDLVDVFDLAAVSVR